MFSPTESPVLPIPAIPCAAALPGLVPVAMGGAA